MMKQVVILIIILLFSGISAADVQGEDNDTLTEITSVSSFNAYIENQSRWYNQIYDSYYASSDEVLYDMAPAPAATSAAPEVAQKSVSGGGATEYSTTNVQVVGVDEADFLKNDGKYIYMLRNNGLTISEVYPVDTGRVISQIPLAGTPSGMFLSGDRLVVFLSTYGEIWKYPASTEAPVPVNGDITYAAIYDVSNRARPEMIREITLPGSYENGRMIGEVIYAITRDSIYNNDPIMPVVYEGKDILARPSIWCPPIPMNQFSLYTITSFDLTKTRDVKATSFLMGYDNTLYVSADNAYMAYKKWSPYWWGWNWRSSSSVQPDKGEESVIHRFSLDDGTISFKATGSFPGYLLNQFSLDESDGNIRVATTNERYTNDAWIQDNNVYVLSSSLDTLGSLEHLAPGERIYSARFIGDLLYLVTFKQTDPLFVIDLSNPKQPGILGELKIPGYSDYLHPFDKTHLIGIGKDTEENENGGVIPTGVKVAIFDVSDLKNPRLMDSRVIGEKGSSSEILSDHKAFLLDANRSIMVLPIKEVVRIPIRDSKFPESYTTASWQGAYVIGIDPSRGFTDKGKIEQDQMRPNDYYWSGSAVRRSVVMDSVLYTVSDNRIIGSDIDNPDNRFIMIDLPESGP